MPSMSMGRRHQWLQQPMLITGLHVTFVTPDRLNEDLDKESDPYIKSEHDRAHFDRCILRQCK